jgi:hypothetical protein
MFWFWSVTETTESTWFAISVKIASEGSLDWATASATKLWKVEMNALVPAVELSVEFPVAVTASFIAVVSDTKIPSATADELAYFSTKAVLLAAVALLISISIPFTSTPVTVVTLFFVSVIVTTVVVSVTAAVQRISTLAFCRRISKLPWSFCRCM